MNDALIFCESPRGELFYLFVISGVNKKGEMKTRYFDYQDLGNNDPWFKGNGDFERLIRDLIELIQQNAPKSKYRTNYQED